jgi:hypothetical protein
LDQLDHHQDSQPPPEHALMYKYYSDIGRLDPYERYQDRIRKKLIETARLVAHHLWQFWKASFHWALGMTRVVRLRVPNILFILIGAVASAYAGIWIFSWHTATAETFPQSVRVTIEFFESTKIVVEAKREWSIRNPRYADESNGPVQPRSLGVVCPLDAERIDLWPIVSEMITDHAKRRRGKVTCTGESEHSVDYDIRITY